MCNDVYGYNNHRFELQPGFAGVLRAEAPLAHLDGSPDLPQAMAKWFFLTTPDLPQATAK